MRDSRDAWPARNASRAKRWVEIFFGTLSFQDLIYGLEFIFFSYKKWFKINFKRFKKIKIFKFLAGQKSTFPQVDRVEIFCGSYLGAKLPFEPKKSRVTGLAQNFVLPYYPLFDIFI